ncbi:MAG: glycosyltransferase family 39 protein [Oligoflexia bacterium]|nr:glycosyltransferase family 39 protein [Oligoflexia bacterium]
MASTDATSPSLAHPRPIRLGWKVAFSLLFALVLGVYARSLNVPFHFDDTHAIADNPAVHGLSHLGEIWTDTTASSIYPDNRNYRPLTFTVYALCWQLGGGELWAFHLVKILMHAIVCLMIFLIWRRLWKEPSWFPEAGLKFEIPFGSRGWEMDSELAAFVLAALFAIHPACSEVVTYICANTTLQSAMFYLLATWAFLRFWDSGKIGWQAASTIFYAGSVLSKEEGITFPAAAALLILFLKPGKPADRIKAALRATWPLWIACLGLGFIVKTMIPAVQAKSRGNLPPLEYFFTQWRAYLWYMRLWFWPWDLNADNTDFGFSHSILDPMVIQALIGNLLLAAFGWWNRKRFPALLFGLLWFYLTIAPASSIVPLAEPVNEHRMYVSYFGFVGGTFAVLLWFFQAALKPGLPPKAASAILALVILGLVIGTENRITVWKSDENLWADTVEKNPNSGRAMNNLALVYMHSAQYDKALDLLNRCEKVWSSYNICPLNKGIIYTVTGNAVEAEKSLNRAISLDPDNIWTNFFLGKYYESQKAYPKAIETYAKADRLSNGTFIEAKTRIAELELLGGNREHAQQIANDLLRLDPNNALVQALLSKLQSPPVTAAKH